MDTRNDLTALPQAATWLHPSRWLTLLVLVVSLFATWQLWKNEQHNAEQELRSEFDFHARETNSHIVERMQAYEQVLRGVAGLLSHAKGVSRQEFRNYFDRLHLDENYPGIQGLAFLQVVPQAQKDSHIAAIRGEGYPEYSIKPEGRRVIYTPVVYIEPFSAMNRRVFGYDPYADPVRRKAMDSARDTNQAAISGKLRLVQENGRDVQPGFIMFLPIYKNGAPHATLAERRANIVGWVSAPFRMGDLMFNLLSDHSALLDFEIYDGEEMSERTRMYDSDGNPGSRLGAQFQSIRQIMVADHVWTVAARSHTGFEQRMENDKAQLVAYAGTAASLLLAWLTWLLASGHARAVKVAREMTRELSESKARYQQMFDETASIVFLLDPDSGRIVDANAAAVAFWGYPLDELRNMSITRINTSTPEEIREALGKVRANTIHYIECQHRLKSGEIRDVEVYSSPLSWQGGTLLYSILHDITERRRLEEELGRSERKLRDIYDSVGDCIEIISADGRILDMNRIGYERLGYTREEMVGHSLSEFAVAEQAVHIAARMELMRKQGHATFESARRGKDGTIMPLEVRSRRIEFGGQEVFIGISRDISERKRAEDALREKEERLALATLHNGVGIWDWNLATQEMIWDESMYALYRIKPADFAGTEDAWRATLHPDDLEREDREVEAAIRGEKPFDTEFRVVWPGGEIRHIKAVAKVFRDEQGTPLRMLGTNVDITERKNAEEMLRKLSAAVEQSAASIVITDLDACIQYINPHFTVATGYSADEAIGKNPRILQSGQTSRETYAELWGRLTSGREWTGELLNKRKNGELYWEDVSIAPIKNSQGVVTHYVAVKTEITERKKMEAALAESEQRYRTLIENSPFCIHEIDLAGRLQSMNHAGLEMMGLDEEKKICGVPYMSAVSEQDGGRIKALLQDAIDGSASHFEFAAAGDVPLYFKSCFIPIKSADGRVLKLMGITEDITERKRLEQQLKESEEVFHAIFEQAPNGVELIDPDTLRFVEVNPAACRMLGYTHEEYLQLHLEDTQAVLQGEALLAAVRRIEETGGGEVFQNRHRCKNGDILDVEITSRVLNIPGKRLLVGVWRDITESKRVEENLRITASVFDTSQEAILITDANNLITEVNPAFTQITSYTREEVLGRNPKLLSSGRHDKAFYAEMWQTLKREKSWRGEVWNRRKSGEIYAELLSISAICDADGRVQRHVAVFSDISHFKEYEEELNRIAHYDALTGIPNRMLLADRMKQAISQTARAGDMMAVCYLDLDGFKPVNDTLGHEAGDRVLVEIAKRLNDTIRGGDTAARLGGDEFVVLLLGLERGEECVATLERLLAAIGLPIPVKDSEITLGASIGVSIYPLDDEEPDTLLRHADQAMYVAKQAGKNRFHIYDPALDQRARDQHEFLRSIRHGMEHGQLELHYQPKVNLRTKQMVGAEALIRWRHPERGLLLPVEFLRMTENTDLDIEIGEWVIATALAQIDRWHRAGLDIEVSINISAYHLESSGFAEKLRREMERYPDLPPDRLQIEVLETVALNDIAIVRKIIEVCHKFGVSFALDDFGTGYSSLSYLNSLPVDALKIDQSFVRDMLEDKGDMAIVQGVIALAHAFGRETVAEGIETDEHYQALLEMGCELGQGYGIARPMLADELTNWKAG